MENMILTSRAGCSWYEYFSAVKFRRETTGGCDGVGTFWRENLGKMTYAARYGGKTWVLQRTL